MYKPRIWHGTTAERCVLRGRGAEGVAILDIKTVSHNYKWNAD